MKNENNWIDRMYELMGNRSQKEFAEWLGESPKRVNNYFSGMVDYPSVDLLLRMIEKGVDVNWFLTGKGNMYLTHRQAGELPANVQTLIHELEGWSEMTDDIIELIRAKKKVLESDEKLKAMFRRKKK